ncbi:pilus assembly protein TadG-related protein [Chelativorans sp. M5D2P16]|uniref:pilus assembly protein TadG-related protein n=1 Tax=Chelativorans sp. M5D2P16 TaxID=3095678 RepID=UPI002ACB0085|nr:pilus assembly protein TadG-related protein [Chelativorans sp. M5D2P16]MDZ5698108.1 TadG family pilus assembly protein [Chelativorans sp. M5D2P16]
MTYRVFFYRRLISRWLTDRGGSIAVMSALMMTLVFMAAAIAIDFGSLYFERREAQALTDLAAITAAGNLDKAEAAAVLAMNDNGQDGVSAGEDESGEEPDEIVVSDAAPRLEVETGRYVADPAVDPAVRFTANATPANAARVTYTKTGALHFAHFLMDPPSMRTTAIAATTEEAAFSVGSRLASLDEGVLNNLLGALLGANVSLKAMDYRALADADVEVLSFLDALAAEIDLTAGTYNDVIAAEAAIGDILRALSVAAGQNQDARLALLALANAPGLANLHVPMGKLLDIGSLGQLALGERTAGLEAVVGVMDLLGASAAVANHDTLVDMASTLDLPGLASFTLDIAIGEPPQGLPWFAVGEAGKIVRTAQTRLFLNIEVEGPGGTLGEVIRLPLYLEVAYAEAKLDGISCSRGEVTGVAIDARPGIVEAWVGEIDPDQLRYFDARPALRPAKLVDLKVVRITGEAHAVSGNRFPTRLDFSRAEIDSGAVRSVHTHDIAQPLVRSLLKDLDLDVDLKLGPLQLGLSSPDLLADTLAEILGEVAGPLDTLLSTLLTTLGVKVGEADVRVTGAACGRAVLVN